MRSTILSFGFLLPFLSAAQTTAQIELVPWATGLPNAVDMAHAGDDRLFVVQQDGLIRIVTGSMEVAATPFLDLTDSVLFDGEQGLLGLAFDPEYASNGRFYVNYISDTGGRHSRISRFSVSNDPDIADPTSEEIIYTIPQPFANHNGGDLAFGPDGMLYVPFGDGGDAGDPLGNAQDLSDPLGDIIRIDVSDPNATYTVPADNPYVGSSGILPEIWASGLRNPYRFGFDTGTGDLWIGDVGQGEWEEIDHIPSGSVAGWNFGWRCYEGFETFNTDGCMISAAYDEPVTVHANGGNGWCAIIGGRVYRGAAWPQLQGRYIYADYCVGDFWSLMMNDEGDWVDEPLLVDNATGWSSIAEGADGELYTTNVNDGTLFKIVDRCPMGAPTITFDGDVLTSTTAGSYVWYLNSNVIPGATGQTYEPLGNGEYFVEATTGSCMLKSNIIMVISTSISASSEVSLAFQPNPANEVVNITWNDGAAAKQLRVLDATGREVATEVLVGGSRVLLSTASYPEGHYVVQLRTADNMLLATQRLTVIH